MKKEFIKLLLLVGFNIFLRVFLAFNIPFDVVYDNYSPIYITPFIINTIDVLNIILIWFLIKIVVSNRLAFLTAMVYSLSFWSIYYSQISSINILVIFLILVTLILHKKFEKQKFLWIGLLGLTLISYIFINLKNSSSTLIYNNQAVLNSINTNRGTMNHVAQGFLGLILENKITYFGRLSVFNFVDHFSPVYYFTPQNKMLGFSFTPPILIGFLIPMFFGFSEFILLIKKHKALIAILGASFIPSILSVSSPDLNKAILILPFLCVITSFGIDNLINTKKFFSRPILFLTLFLVIFQCFTIFYDINTREQVRFLKYHNVK